MEGILHRLAGHQTIDEAVFQEKLGALEIIRKFLLDCLFDDTPSREAYQCSRFRDIHVANRRKGSADSTRGRIGENRDERNLFVIKPGDARAGFCHLHKR